MPEQQYAFYMSWLHRLIYNHAWPYYECECCVGQEEWQGCWCAYNNAIRPGYGPSRYNIMVRKLWSVIARRCGMYDPSKH